MDVTQEQSKAREDAFRTEVREFISSVIPPDMAARVRRGYHPLREDVVFWTRALAERGWSTPSWPVEFGGPGWTLRQRHIFEEECFRLGAPEVSPPGNALVGPILIAFGSKAQQERFLPKIRTAEEFWAQGFSEPNAGSDLASLRTRADRDGDHYVVNGQKVWTSEAQIADWLFLLVRTDSSGKPQAGISFLLVDIRSPGVTVRPIISIDEGHSLNEVFFSDVRVPVENLVGEENKGWTYAKHLLGAERSFSAAIPRCKRELSRVKEIAARTRSRGAALIDDAAFAARVAQLEIELLAHEATVWRVVADEEQGRGGETPAASVLKIKGSELLQAIGQLAVEALGDDAAPAYPEREYRAELPNDIPFPEHAPGVVAEFMYRRSMTIYGGANEIQRNIIAAALLRP